MSWKAAGAQVLEEGGHRLAVLFRAGHQREQELLALGGETPGRQHRLAPLPRPDAPGDAVDEQIDDLVLAQVPARELLVVRPQPLADLRGRRPGEQQAAGLVLEGVLDVAHR